MPLRNSFLSQGLDGATTPIVSPSCSGATFFILQENAPLSKTEKNQWFFFLAFLRPGTSADRRWPAEPTGFKDCH